MNKEELKAIHKATVEATPEEECGMKGHCTCYREQDSVQCCLCGAFDEVRHKEASLKYLRQKIKQMKDKYPDEVRDICNDIL